MQEEDREIVYDPGLKGNLGDWGLTDDDIGDVIAAYESGCYFEREDPDLGKIYLARNNAENANVYVEFTLSQSTVTVYAVYAHRIQLNSDAVEDGLEVGSSDNGAGSGWTCARCGVPVIAIDDIFLHYLDVELGTIDGFRCPSCGYEMIDYDTVMVRMYMSEMMLEVK